MQAMELERLEKIAEGLALAFYVLMFVALVMGLAGLTGSGLLMLILGSCAYVGQASLGEFVEMERGQGRSRRGSREAERVRRERRVAASRPATPVEDRVRVGSGR
jgi:hypothetical protein